ncbi:MAG: CDP-glycerol glycerophosphotransferase family protein [Verrucomicrobia bacterium]|nr:CDP-glycerol glycerophosphotransferase family protein [Verrucomicrobiota bacterium]MDA1007049.1 CDP-glycerol glycerophosphotransferase family protein [Verrucomicrobiota bacterium]
MNQNSKTTILFAGYAPVHFVCFQPLYDVFRALPGFEVKLSGGLRSEGGAPGVYKYDLEGLYDPFGIPRDEVVSVEELPGLHFDVGFSSQTNAIHPEVCDRVVQIFHGISFRNRSIRAENSGYDHYFLVGPYMHRNFVEAGLLEEDDPRAIRIGFLKTDRLLNGRLDRSALLAKYGFDGSRPVLLYAPTGQKGNSMEVMGKDVIKRLLKEDRYDILVKLHDHPKKEIDWPKRLAKFDGPHFKVASDLDVIPLLHLADLLITDASSVSSEFSLLDRPMVFLDVPELIERAGRKDGARVDLDTWGRNCGPVAGTPEEACVEVARSLASPERFGEVRQAMARDLFYHPGCATEAATEWIRKEFGVEEGQVALGAGASGVFNQAD